MKNWMALVAFTCMVAIAAAHAAVYAQESAATESRSVWDGVYTEDYWEAPKLGCIKSESVLGGGKILLTLREFKSGK